MTPHAFRKQIRRRVLNGFSHRGLHPVLERVYAGRQVTSPCEIDYSLDRLLDPGGLPGIGPAVEVLEQAVRSETRIVFIGDFDTDGATSTALGVLALKSMGASDVGYLVPNRFDFGYGLSPAIVEVAAAMKPGLLITVDNGIGDVEGVEAATRNDIPVLITDHHLPGAHQPRAAAIVNPNLPESAFGSSALAGVGVVFYLMAALRSRLRQTGWFDGGGGPNLADLLDLVALGTVADLVPLDTNNRILVSKGLDRINQGRCRPGIQALLALRTGGVEQVFSSDLGFIVAPRLNAAGRLQDMSLGIECLLAEDPVAAKAIASRLDQLNQQRRSIETEMRAQAMEIVEAMEFSGTLSAGICLYQPSWHQGVVGLIAGRLKDKLGRPVVAFARAGDGQLKGSARSIPGLHIRDLLNVVSRNHPGLIGRFGGHAAAAGLALAEPDLDAFRDAFATEAQRLLQDTVDVVYSDGSLRETDLEVDLARLLKRSGPWGQEFPEPQFDGEFEVLDRRVVADHHLKLKIRMKGQRKVFDAIAFFQGDAYDQENMRDGVRLVYRLEVNDYMGLPKPQMIVQYLEGCSDESGNPSQHSKPPHGG